MLSQSRRLELLRDAQSRLPGLLATENAEDHWVVEGVIAKLIADVEANPETSEIPNVFAGSNLLSMRELAVARSIAMGKTNKAAGRDMGISHRTIEVHRTRAMEKVGARNAVDLVRIILSGRYDPTKPLGDLGLHLVPGDYLTRSGSVSRAA